MNLFANARDESGGGREQKVHHFCLSFMNSAKYAEMGGRVEVTTRWV